MFGFKKKKDLFVAFAFTGKTGNTGFGHTIIRNQSGETDEDLLHILDLIKTRNNYPEVVILNWKAM